MNRRDVISETIFLNNFTKGTGDFRAGLPCVTSTYHLPGKGVSSERYRNRRRSTHGVVTNDQTTVRDVGRSLFSSSFRSLIRQAINR